MIVEPTLSAAQREAVAAATAATFPGQPVDGLAKLAQGLSGAGVYKLTVGGRPYLLRVETNRGGLWDPERQYVCLRTAAEAGVAPRAYHLDAAAGIAITAFIEATPMPQLDRAVRREALTAAMRTLHATPLFPAAPDMFTGLDGLWELARSTGVMPEAHLERFHDRYREVRAAYPAPTEPPVSSHNDLNPSNVLFADGRAWLVDWEVAAAADRFYDLATAGHWFCADAAEEEALLASYFGREPDERERARFFLMLQAVRMLMGLLFVVMPARQQPGWGLADEQLDPPPLAALRPRTGELMATPEGRALFGSACLHEAYRATQVFSRTRY